MYFAWRYKLLTSLLRVKFYDNMYANTFTFSMELILFVMERLKTVVKKK